MDNQSGAGNQREFMGLTLNECTFIGKVVGDPVIQNDNYAFLNLKTSVGELGANGQWNDVIIQIPCITMDPKKVASINTYVKDGRQLMIRAYYKPWVQDGAQQHAFMIIKLSFGSKKWDPDANKTATPALPVQ
jgi:hypothetical protein